MRSQRPTPPFPFKAKRAIANDESTQMIAKRVAEVRNQYISSTNNMTFSHGSGWQSDYPGSPNEGGEFQLHESETRISYQDIVAHDTSILRRSQEQIAISLSDQIKQSVFATVSEAANSVGNTVSTNKSLSHTEAILATFEKIEFGVDADGKVSFPTIYTGNHEMIRELEAAGPDFQDRLEKIKQRKSEEALAKDRKRKSRFKKRDDIP